MTAVIAIFCGLALTSCDVFQSTGDKLLSYIDESALDKSDFDEAIETLRSEDQLSDADIESCISALDGEKFNSLLSEACTDFETTNKLYSNFCEGYEGFYGDSFPTKVAPIYEAVAGKIGAAAAAKFTEESIDTLLEAMLESSRNIGVSREALIEYLSENGTTATAIPKSGFYANETDSSDDNLSTHYYGDFKVVTKTSYKYEPSRDNGRYDYIINNDGTTSRVWVPDYEEAHYRTVRLSSLFYKDNEIAVSFPIDSSYTYIESTNCFYVIYSSETSSYAFSKYTLDGCCIMEDIQVDAYL